MKFIEFENIAKSTLLRQLEVRKSNREKIFIHIVNSTYYQRNIVYFWDILSPKEKYGAKKCYNLETCNKYIIAHGILRCILAYYICSLPNNIKYTYNKYGKPFLKDCNIQFNMSHSHEILGYIVAFDKKVGIDIECHNVNIKPEEFYDIAFTENERKLVNAFPIDQQYKVFYDIWTKKEAIVKAHGSGLSYPVNTIETSLGSEVSSKIITTIEGNQLKCWACRTLNIKPSYSGAVAIEIN